MLNSFMEEDIRHFLAYIQGERGYSRNTVAAYRRDFAKFTSYLAGISVRSFQEVTQDNFSLFLRQLKEDELDPNSVRRTLAACKSLFKFLSREERVSRNIPRMFDSPKTWKKAPLVLTYEEILRMLECPIKRKADYLQKAVIEMAYGCGLRASELCDLNISDIYFDQGFITVFGKGEKQRHVPINTHALKAIRLYWEKCRKKDSLKEDNPVFLTQQGFRLDRIQVWRIIQKYAELSGIKKNISPHTLRHSYATHLYQNGVDIRVLQELLGHSSIIATELYVHINNREVIAKFHRFSNPRECVPPKGKIRKIRKVPEIKIHEDDEFLELLMAN